MLPSPTDLAYFLEVANFLNLSRASEALNISQPSLTLAMRRLEKSLGTRILMRHKRGVSLTKAGKQLLINTRLLIQQWETIKTDALSNIQDVQGHFTLGCPTSVALYALPKFLPQLLTKHNGLNIQLVHDISRLITEKVIQLEVDIGIVINPIQHPDLIIRKLADDKTMLWGARANLKQDLLMGDPNLLQTQFIIKALKKQRYPFKQFLATPNLEVAAALAKNNGGIAILPTCVAKAANLKPIPNTPAYGDELCVIYREENRNMKAIQVIVNTIRDAY